MRLEGEQIEEIENFDGDVARAWFDRCVAEGRELWGDPDEPESWVRGWRLVGRHYVRCTVSGGVQLNPPGRMHADAAINPASTNEHPEAFADRPMVRDVVFERTTLTNPRWVATGAILDEVVLDDIRAEINLELCALRHVTLRGRLGPVWINWSSGADRRHGGPPGERTTHQERVDAQNERFHADADWILDISEGISRDWSIRDVQPEKVRLDPVRQAFVSTASLAPGRALLEERPLLGTCGSVVRKVLDGRDEEVAFVHVTPRSRHLDEELALLSLLADEGLTLPTAPRPPTA